MSVVEDKANSWQALLWSWGYPWRISILRCKPDLLQSMAASPFLSWESVGCIFDVPVTTGLTLSRMGCKTAVWETDLGGQAWPGTQEASLEGNEQLGRAVEPVDCTVGWRREQEPGQRALAFVFC